MADGDFLSLDSTGAGVSVCRLVNGERWRVAVSRGDTAALAAAAPELTPEQVATVVKFWEGLPPVVAVA